jgi:hypothetical protein
MRRLAGILIAVGLVILVIILLFKAFSGGHPSTATNAPKPLIDYAGTDVTMQMTIEGDVTADQNHLELQISVGSTSSQINIFQGYQQTLLNTSSYSNNQNAYADFLRALDLAGYRLGNSRSSLNNEQGYCEAGERYVFEIVEDNQDLQRYWTSSCGAGNFKGSLLAVLSLFERQIPNYGQLTDTLNFEK